MINNLKYKTMKLSRITKVLLLVPLMFQFIGCQNKHDRIHENINDKISPNWQSLNLIEETGLLGARLDLWREKRLWYVADSGFLLSGFESRPGIHPWQGEHMGKQISPNMIPGKEVPQQYCLNQLLCFMKGHLM